MAIKYRAIPNATESTLVLNSLQDFESGFYKCVLTNDCGTVTTTAAELAVLNSDDYSMVYVTTFGELFDVCGISGAKTIVLCPGTFTMTADLPIPANKDIWVLTGASIVTTGYTFTCNGTFHSGRYTIFSGTGTVVFGTNATNVIYPEWWGATSTAMQYAMTCAVKSGSALDLSPYKTYAQTTALTFQRTASGTTQSNILTINGNGATLDWSASGLTSGILLTVGASSQANSSDGGKITLNNFTIKGPETATPAVGVTPDGTTEGLLLSYALQVTLDSIQITNCYKGFRTFWSFPITSRFMTISSCYISHHVDATSTLATYITSQFKQSYIGLLVKSVATTGGISAQTFIQPRCEDCLNGIHLDSAINMSAICITDPYFEDITYDLVRMGIAFTLATPQTRGSNSANNVICPTITGGLWDDGNFATTHMGLVFDSNNNVYGGTFNIPILRTEIVNAPFKSIVNCRNSNYYGQGSDVDFTYPGLGWVTFAGSSGTITYKSGNIASVTRNSAGRYTIVFTEVMRSDYSYSVSGTCIAADGSHTPTLIRTISMAKEQVVIETVYDTLAVDGAGAVTAHGWAVTDASYVTIAVNGIV